MPSYTKQGPFNNGGPPGISAAILNVFDNGIDAAHNNVLVSQIGASTTEVSVGDVITPRINVSLALPTGWASMACLIFCDVQFRMSNTTGFRRVISTAKVNGVAVWESGVDWEDIGNQASNRYRNLSRSIVASLTATGSFSVDMAVNPANTGPILTDRFVSLLRVRTG